MKKKLTTRKETHYVVEYRSKSANGLWCVWNGCADLGTLEDRIKNLRPYYPQHVFRAKKVTVSTTEEVLDL